MISMLNINDQPRVCDCYAKVSSEKEGPGGITASRRGRKWSKINKKNDDLPKTEEDEGKFWEGPRLGT